MGRYVLSSEEVDQTQVSVAGGKGAHLGELSRIEGIRVPGGFCVTTDGFQRIMAAAASLDDPLDRLPRLQADQPDDGTSIRALSGEVRGILEGVPIPDDLAAAVTRPSPGSASKPPTPSDPARRRRTCPELVLSTSPAISLDNELVAVLTVGTPVGLGICWACMHRAWATGIKVRG